MRFAFVGTVWWRRLQPNATYFGLVGQAILPAAAFQAALFGPRASLRTRKFRLKAGCSQDWLPHNLCRICFQSKVSDIGLSVCRVRTPANTSFADSGRSVP